MSEGADSRLLGGQWHAADLLTLRGMLEQTECRTSGTPAGQGERQVWWEPYRDLLSFPAQVYLDLEQAATRIRGFESQFIPALLQTESYARAALRVSRPHAPEEEIERRVELRMHRRQVLHRARPPHLWMVIDEAVLRRATCGLAVMREQLRHLMDVSAGLPHVTVQVLPFESGERVVTGAPVTLFRLADGGLPDVACLEQPTGVVYPDSPADLDYYRHVMNRLATEAARVASTPTLLRGILSDL